MRTFPLYFFFLSSFFTVIFLFQCFPPLSHSDFQTFLLSIFLLREACRVAGLGGENLLSAGSLVNGVS